MAQELKTSHKTFEYYNSIQRSRASAYINGEISWATKKAKLITDMKLTFVEMKKYGFYDEPVSHICASICSLIQEAGGNENSDAYVRMNLEEEYKETSHTTHDSILKKALRVADKDVNNINLFEKFSVEDFNSLSDSDKIIFKEKYLDLIKESKRRIKNNKEVLNIVVNKIKEDSKQDDTVDGQAVNDTALNVISLLRESAKNTKKIHRSLNSMLDKVDNSQDIEDEYLTSLEIIQADAKALNNKIVALVTKIEKH